MKHHQRLIVLNYIVFYGSKISKIIKPPLLFFSPYISHPAHLLSLPPHVYFCTRAEADVQTPARGSPPVVRSS